MLAVARDEHMVALPTVNEPPPEEDGAAAGGSEHGERGARGRRPLAEVKED
jgi:hypothetical protein